MRIIYGLSETHNSVPPVWWDEAGVAVRQAGCSANSLEGTVVGSWLTVKGYRLRIQGQLCSRLMALMVHGS